MRIAMLGTRGVPAAYSGFETCVERVGMRLASRGHTVIVYGRAGRVADKGADYLGMTLVTLPAIKTKGLETLTHTAASTVHALVAGRPEVVVIFGVGNAIFGRAFGLARIPVAINVDGADWARRKWGGLGRRYLRWSEGEAVASTSAVIADSLVIKAYYERQYGASPTFIPYGADIPALNGRAALERFGLQPRGYFLSVGRMVPENGFHHLIEAYKRSNTGMPFVVVGDAPYSEGYKRHLREVAPASVVFTGYQFGAAYHELSAHAFAFLFGAEVGGTHPVLVEQLAHGNCVLGRWTESNAEVMGEAGMLFRDLESELPPAIQSLVAEPALAEGLRERARRRATVYSWDRVADEYERLLQQLRASSAARHAKPTTR